MVADRCRKSVEEADKLQRQRRLFLDDIDNAASIVRETVIFSVEFNNQFTQRKGFMLSF